MDPKEKETLNEEQLNTEETTDCTDAPQEEAAATDTNQNQGEETPVLSVEEELARQLEEANATIEEQKDKYLRLSAEFDNYRKRTLKEKAELILNGGEKCLAGNMWCYSGHIILSVIPLILKRFRGLYMMCRRWMTSILCIWRLTC